MRRPQAVHYIVLTLFAGALGIMFGARLHEFGRFPVFLLALSIFPAWIYFVMALWDMPRHHPLNYVLALPFLAALVGSIVAWINWTGNSDHLLKGNLGAALGAVLGLFCAPGLLRRFYRWRIRPGVPLINLIEGLSDGDVSVRRRAAAALKSADMPAADYAVGALLVALEDGDPEVRGHAGDALRALDVMYDASDLPTATVPGGSLVLRLLGWSVVLGLIVLAGYGIAQTKIWTLSETCLYRDYGGAWAAPALLARACDNDMEVSRAGRDGLNRLGAAAVPTLIQALGSSDARVRDIIVEALAAIGPPAKDAVPALQKAASGWSDKPRQGSDTRSDSLRAVGALAEIDPASLDRFLPALIRWLQDGDRAVQRSALYCMLKMGPRARTAVPQIRQQMTATEDTLKWLRDPRNPSGADYRQRAAERDHERQLKEFAEELGKTLSAVQAN